ncbi:hypothetical protein HGO97_015040 [Faecalicatena sp. AGMB00832]|uniref:Papain-like cysteine peptidase DUF1796 n=1 Tax=Faecalicatena faecalis TaxID=2726362 RepID=A0ABS6D6L2_9FIRM|nr:MULTISPECIES: hypothetical protein [Faecalicatena]MBU3877124.1 hypothetical protein [Faecalicatena faecalis]MCI6467129.1 hypothetical protein [Faecalicatena sp.]MDY5618913.1 hypothetical protein [Lachnospiraceae bacterium]
MKKMLDYFTIDGEIGGNQDWFRNVVMHVGGCAAATACDCCIYFALHQGQTHLYPYDAHHLEKEDYIQFSMKMKPYIRPRAGGVKKLEMFIDGFSNYLRDVGDHSLKMEGFSGEDTDTKASALIKAQIDAGFPVPYLMLRHTNPEYKDFVWHWFLCYGYEEKEDDFLITVATYGEATTFSLKDLWNTGYEEKGGLIRLFRN